MASLDLRLIFTLILAASVRSIGAQQPLSFSGGFLVTSVGVGSPAQNFDLALNLDDGGMFVLDQRTANPDVDFTYDYVKQLFVPERSQSVNVSAFACRLRMTDGNQQMQTTAGVYATDVLTLNGHASDGIARFCDLNTPRTAAKQKDDELKWLMQLPVDGLLGLDLDRNNPIQRAGIDQITLSMKKTPTDNDNVGTFTVGRDAENCDKDVRFFPAASARQKNSNAWRLMADNVTHADQSVGGPLEVRVDLQSDVLVVPKPIYNSILKAFGGRSYGRCAIYANPPPVQLLLQGAAYSVEMSDYFRPSANNPDFCNLLVDQTAPNAEVDVVLGRSFLSHFCVLLDYANAQLGLAATR